MAARPKEQDRRQVISKLETELQNCRSTLARVSESERMYRELVECTDELILRVNRKGHLTFINRMATEVVGIAADRLIGRPAFDLIHSDDRQNNRQAFLGWINDRMRRLTFENRIVNQVTGQVYCMLWTITICYDDNGRFKAMNCIGKDLTRRKQAELELKQLAHQLAERVKELNCLIQISRLREKTAFSLDEVIQKIIELIPASMQYPDITAVRVAFDGYAYQTDNFRCTEWKLERDVIVNGEQACTLQVCYTQPPPQRRPETFMEEEHHLASAIAEQLGTIIEREWAEIELRRHRERLEKLLSSRTAELLRSNKRLEDEVRRRLAAEKALLEAEAD